MIQDQNTIKSRYRNCWRRHHLDLGRLL